MEKFFLHRIQKENGNFSKGIEIHDTLDSAVLSYCGRAKLAYGKNPAITFMSLKIKDGTGKIAKASDGTPYEMAWKAESETENVFFLHHVRLDDATYDKNIDPYDSEEIAKADFASQMEYGFGNTKHPKVTYVSCCVTDVLSGGLELMDSTWEKATEPEPEPAE